MIITDFSKFQTGDIFFTNEKGFIGGFIRLGETGKIKDMFSREIVNHTGIIFNIYDQMFCAELTKDGPDITDIDKYRSKNNQIISVYRPTLFKDPVLLDQVAKYLAYWARKRKQKKYDPIGAISSSRWVQKLLPFIKDNPKRDFCSEYVYTFLKNFKHTFPMSWCIHKPNPLMVFEWMIKHPEQYTEIV